jgi:hypothetical protein
MPPRGPEAVIAEFLRDALAGESQGTMWVHTAACAVYTEWNQGAENRHIDMRTSGWRGAHGTRPVPIAQELGRHTQRRQDVQPTMPHRITTLHEVL